jgi:hypothetical protein
MRSAGSGQRGNIDRQRNDVVFYRSESLRLVRRAGRSAYDLSGTDSWRGYRDEDKKWEELGNKQPHLLRLFRSRAWKTGRLGS